MSSLKTAAGTRTGAGFCFSDPVIEPGYPEYVSLSRTMDYVAITAAMVIPDLDIPHLYERIAPTGTSALLESLAGKENGRYSIIGYAPLYEIESYNPSTDYETLLRSFIHSIRFLIWGCRTFPGTDWLLRL